MPYSNSCSQRGVRLGRYRQVLILNPCGLGLLWIVSHHSGFAVFYDRRCISQGEITVVYRDELFLVGGLTDGLILDEPDKGPTHGYDQKI